VKKTFLVFVVLAMTVFAFSGCDKDDNDDDYNDQFPAVKGRLTVTGLGNFNNKYVYASGLAGGNVLQGITAATGSSLKLAKIANDKAEVPLYVPNGLTYSAYSGNDAVTTISIYILDADTLDSSNAQNVIFSNLGMKTITSGTFSGGNMTVTWEWTPYNYTPIQLTENQWSRIFYDSPDRMDNWFTFIATAPTQYIHAKISDRGSVFVKLYDNEGNSEPINSQLSNTIVLYVARTVTPGKKYYIDASTVIAPISYQIAFNSSSTPPVSP
jgi:hypothetical protein